ncbi:MAG: hypothetical protein LUC97_01975 [Clostridiales bacterium]|nr:hypothetical protein [Clostridiales bacterium]
MTKSQLKAAYVNWNKEISKLSDRQIEIIRELQSLCEENNCPKSCCLERLVENLVKEGLVFKAMYLVEEYYKIDGQEEALRTLALATDNFDNAV